MARRADVSARSAPQNNSMQTYRVGENLHTFNPPAIPGLRHATIKVTDHMGTTYTYGPYEVMVDIEDGGYPVTGDTESWWRSLDINVNEGEIVFMVSPSATPLQNPP